MTKSNASIEPVEPSRKPTPNTLILGQVVGVHIDPAYLKDGLFDIAAAGTIARCGYRGDHVEVTQVFEILRPSS